MAFARTTPLRRELEAALPERPFSVQFWDGSAVEATQPAAPTFFVRSPLAMAHLLRAPGELGLGRAYVSGLLDVDDMEGALEVVDTFEPPALSLRQRGRLLAGVVRACGLVRPPQAPASELRLRGERHTIWRDRLAVRHHYDVGNDFFALFLDRSMTYSCAYWQDGARTLEEAQEAKLELICRKLGLEPGRRVLEIGCGWGSFALHAASRHSAQVVGITLSERQAELARRRVADAGLAERIEIRLADYRELSGEQFDSIASIEMVEAVGEERIDEYGRRLAALLKPGGSFLNQGISKLKDFATKDEGPFSERFVFPDGVPLPLSRVELAFERSGLATRHVEGLQDDYPKTLSHWIERYDGSYDEAVRLAGSERARVWRLYLRAARQGFQTGWASIYQVLTARP